MITYLITEPELRQLHARQVTRVLRNRIANMLLPWRWLARENPRVEWVTWEALLRQCARPEGFTVALTERGQEICYRLYRPPSPLGPERYVNQEPRT